MRAALALLTPAQQERSTTVPQLVGLIRVGSISDEDVPFMFRGAMLSLP
jgi:hypothetical protein